MARSGGTFPGREQALLLEVALAESGRALAAWAEWRALRGERGLNLIDPASSHLLPLVTRRLGELPSDGWEQHKLRGVHRKSLTRNVLLLHKTSAAEAALAGAGIDAVRVGGAALATEVYPDRGARYLTEAELWLPGDGADRVARATEAVLGCGAGWRASAAPQADYQILHGDDELTLVLRGHFLPESRRSPGADAEVRARVSRRGAVRTLAREDALVHAAVTGAVWTPHALVDWLPDLALLVRAGIDDEKVVAVASRYAASLAVGAALGWLLPLGVPVPATLLAALVRVPKTELEREAWAMRTERPPDDPQALWAEWRHRFVPEQGALQAALGFPRYAAARLGLASPAELPRWFFRSVRGRREA